MIPTSRPQIPSTTILYARTEFDRTSLCIKLLVCVFGGVVARHRVLSDLGLTNEHQPSFSQPTVKTRFFSFTQIWTQWDGNNSAFWGKTPHVYFNGPPKSPVLAMSFTWDSWNALVTADKNYQTNQKPTTFFFSHLKKKANHYMKLFKDWDQFVSTWEIQYSCTE